MFRNLLSGAVLALVSVAASAAQSWDTTTPTSAIFSADQSSYFEFELSGDASVFTFASASKDLALVQLDGYNFSNVLESPELWVLTVPHLAAGTHRLAIYTDTSFVAGVDTFSGQVGISGATFSAQAVSPVPEPGAVSLLAAGLGAMGFMFRRRRRS